MKRIGLLIIFVLGVAFVYEKFVYQTTLQSEGWLKKIGERSFAKHPDILYFSASPNCAYFEGDIDKRSIHQFIQDSLNQLITIDAIDTGSMHAGIFLHALRQFPKGYRPKQIVMDLNLRSFGNRWIHSDLENSFQRNLVYWNHLPGLYNRFQAFLKNYKYIQQAERNELIFYDDAFNKLPFSGNCQTVKKWTDSLDKRADHADKMGREMVAQFGFTIDSTNPMLLYYQQIVDFCQLKKIPLLLVILPENLEEMENKAGKNLKRICLKNVLFLTQYFKNQKVELINDVGLLNKSYFYEPFPTEHYIAAGRKKVANSILGKLEERSFKTKN